MLSVWGTCIGIGGIGSILTLRHGRNALVHIALRARQGAPIWKDGDCVASIGGNSLIGIGRVREKDAAYAEQDNHGTGENEELEIGLTREIH